ncbi:hypothetical protein IVA96_27285 [Bradyrhizobium sp. 159]|uniref:hypothetical protein n=1 Tax=Bradyrhizobium sp. 159 TaxID=2782632 RepID=UPI001FFC1AEB|nr:hypothetical protein [Bradyrhizobium sp. 159]MCK1620215.1 hypothetical protein [Bradyrhizobium sp. 159]
MNNYYGRSIDILARAHATLDRLANIDADIAERARREALGLIPEYTPPPPPEPTPSEEEIDGERPMTLAQFEAVMLELMVHLRGEINAVREEVMALKRRRRRKDKSKDQQNDPSQSEPR